LANGIAKTWKFGKMWVGKKANGKKKMFKTRTQAAKFAGTSKKGKTKTKKKSKVRRAGGAIKRRARRNPNRGGSMSKRRAISVNIAKTAAIGGTIAMLSGSVGGLSVMASLRAGNFPDAMARVWLNFKKHWKEILAANIGVAFLSRIAGRFAPSAGVKGAINVKAF
jgi:hypothetical protein